MERQTGETARQIESAPRGAVFVWGNHRIDYPRDLARKLDRDDLEIVSPSWLDGHLWLGKEMSGIVIDHATRLSAAQRDSLEMAMARVGRNHHR